MWEKEKKHIGIKILLVLLILALIAGFYYVYQHIKVLEEAQDAELMAVHQEHQQELNEARQATYDEVQVLYDRDLQTVQQYLPGVVCWGDITTGGTAGGVSYPGVLQDEIDLHIVDRYNFYGTLENTEGIARITDWSVFTVDIPVVNMGTGKETTPTVVGRNGAIPYVVDEAFTIPADSERVAIKIRSSDEALLSSLLPEYAPALQKGSDVNPLTQGDGGINPVTINGIEGTLSLDLEIYYYSQKLNYYFTRLTPGAETEIAEGTEVVTSASSKYLDYIPIIFLGTYDDVNRTVEQLIAYQKAMINHQVRNKDRYLIIGPYYLESRWDRGTTLDLDTFETAMVQEYGDHFINVRKYLCGDGMNDAGLEATKQDTDDIAHGLVPSSLRSTADPSELNATGCRLVGKLVYNWMDKLGYFKEVKDELGITALEKQDRQQQAGYK
ncbi:MAG: hypothetical protein IJ237_04350 [Oscillospiraceae bacterium]|nr:hypothetical protein [Oscillospiraceae bacterium]